MKIRIFAVALLVTIAGSRAAPPELAPLQQQYDKSLAERVTDIYASAITKLDAAYLGGLEREIAEAKSAGDLPTVLGLEAEKKRVSSKEAMPPEDDEKTVAAVKRLRAIYRAQSDALKTKRDAEHAALLASLIASLKKLEGDLTKADRLDEAKAVMDYRTGLEKPISVVSEAAKPATAAPSSPVLAESADIVISGKGFVMGVLQDKQLAFTNRHYAWEKVPSKFRGMRCTKIEGGGHPSISVTAKRDTVVQVFADPNEPGVKLDGWDKTNDHFTVSNGVHEAFHVFTKKIQAGSEIEIPQGSWSGVMVLLPREK